MEKRLPHALLLLRLRGRGKIDGLDAVSIGPDMIAIHTTEEKLSISSTKRVWDYILKVIACK